MHEAHVVAEVIACDLQGNKELAAAAVKDSRANNPTEGSVLRKYAHNCPQAAARIVALAVIADGESF